MLSIYCQQDYASQLWSPVDLQEDLQIQEAPLRSFTKRVWGLQGIPYWESLQSLRLLSCERRQERYKVLYTFKALKGLVPWCGVSIDTSAGPRRGLVARIPPLAGTRAKVQTLKDQSFQCVGPKLWNCLPTELRTLEPSLATFKSRLDSWLAGVSDCPLTVGRPTAATDHRGRQSNSLLAGAGQPSFGSPVTPYKALLHPVSTG